MRNKRFLTPDTSPKKNPFAPQPTDVSRSDYIPFSEAVVVDAVINEDHEFFSEDGYNVGCIRVRSLHSDMYKEESDLVWAFPIDSTIEEWPLINEIVQIYHILNRVYYTRKLNVGNRQNNQAFYGLIQEGKPIVQSSGNLKNIRESTHTPINVLEESEDKLGEYFEEDTSYRLRHWEGDTILQGRTGQAIRFGSSFLDSKVHLGVFPAQERNQASTIILTAGLARRNPVPSNRFGRVVEDFNRDHTSVWMAEDMRLRVDPSAADSPAHDKFPSEFPTKLERNFLAINSGTIFINTKRSGIYVSSKTDTRVSTVRDTYIESGRRYGSYSEDHSTIGSGNRISLMSPKIYIGSRNNTSEPLVLGNTLNDILIQLIQAIISTAPTHVLGTMGPASLNPGLLSNLQQILGQLRSRVILSQDNFVNRNNETV